MKTQSTDEEKQARKEKRIKLVKQLSALTEEQRIELADKIGLPVNPEQHRLSVRNTILIMFQGISHPTMVAGYQQWKKYGRQVRKGEHGVSICFPCLPKDKDGEMQAEGKDLYFSWTAVFDVSQTEPLEVWRNMETGIESQYSEVKP